MEENNFQIQRKSYIGLIIIALIIFLILIGALGYLLLYQTGKIKGPAKKIPGIETLQEELNFLEKQLKTIAQGQENFNKLIQSQTLTPNLQIPQVNFGKANLFE